MTEAIAVDNSTLASTQTCETQAALRYVLGYDSAEDRAPLVAGTAVHAALAAWLKSGGNALEAMRVLEVEYMPWALEHVIVTDDRLSYANVHRVMEYWFDTHPLSSWTVTVRPEMVEVGFAVPIADDVVFVGRADAVGQDARGAWVVVEHKSSARLDERWRRTHRLAAQLTGYTYAMQQHVNAPVVGALVNGIELSRLPNSTTKCRKHGVAYNECGALHARFEAFITQRTPAQQEEWKRTALVLAREFLALKERVKTIDDVLNVRTNGQFTGACASCPFINWCSLGRPTDARTVDAMFTYAPWSPYLHAFGNGDTGKKGK